MTTTPHEEKTGFKRLDYVFWLKKLADRRKRYEGCIYRDTRREMNARMNSQNAKGKGNNAWNRADKIERESRKGCIVWPDYAMPTLRPIETKLRVLTP